MKISNKHTISVTKHLHRNGIACKLNIIIPKRLLCLLLSKSLHPIVIALDKDAHQVQINEVKNESNERHK